MPTTTATTAATISARPRRGDGRRVVPLAVASSSHHALRAVGGNRDLLPELVEQLFEHELVDHGVHLDIGASGSEACEACVGREPATRFVQSRLHGARPAPDRDRDLALAEVGEVAQHHDHAQRVGRSRSVDAEHVGEHRAFGAHLGRLAWSPTVRRRDRALALPFAPRHLFAELRVAGVHEHAVQPRVAPVVGRGARRGSARPAGTRPARLPRRRPGCRRSGWPCGRRGVAGADPLPQRLRFPFTAPS